MMPILRHEHKSEFTIIPNRLLRDNRLSLKDVGLLAFMLSLPDDWQFSIAGFDAILPHDGKDAIAASLRRIEKSGYLRRDRERSANGQIGSVVWYVSDVSAEQMPEPEKPDTVEPDAAKPDTENRSQTKNRLNKEHINKEKIEDAPLVLPFGPELCEVFNDWLEYKKERRQSYKSMGLKNLVSQTQKAAREYGEDAVADIIRTSMSCNYAGILFDRLKSGKPQQKPHNLTFYDLYMEEQ